MAGRADLPRLRVYASSHAHSSIDKAALALGFGLDNVVHIDVDTTFRMRADALASAIAEDRAHGLLPLACVATVGTTSTTSIDPIPAIAEICRREDLWLHVDGAYGGIAAIVPEMRDVLAGTDHADSLVVNPHKWLFTPFDCSAFFTRKPEVLERAFSLVHEYLVTPERESVVDLMNYGVQLGRRFRALKLWMVIRGFGTSGLAARIRSHCALARGFAGWVRAESAWEVVAPVPFSLVCFRYAPAGVHEEILNMWNERLLAAVNASGEVFLSHTKLDGRYVLRLAVGNIRTEEKHLRRAWELLRLAADRTARAD
jgi:aromatic-L-amino-acid decarboxylase